MKCEGFTGDEVVISGIGCKFPESENLDELSKKLFGGEYLVTPDIRKYSEGVGVFDNLPEYSGKVKDYELFDPLFFGVSHLVVKVMDPQTRHTLERSMEAILDAGLNPSELKGTETQVYSGTTFTDYDLQWANYYKEGYGIMGRNRCMNANRVSYWLDVNGTSFSDDSTWTNGILNLKFAFDAIKNDRCDVALVSTANFQFFPEGTIQMNDMGVLSPDGVCRSFDDNANGSVRGDGVAVFVLQRAKYAKRCYAIVEHVITTCIGNRETPLHKSCQQDWEALLRDFYNESKIDVNDIVYVEGHGAGIKEEDAAELNAINNVLCRNRKSPLLVGSIKATIGHSEASAGIASVTKAIVCLENGMVPKNLHYSKPNTLCPGLFDGKLKVVTENTEIPRNGLIAVNCHGFGGTYGHIVLRPNPISRVLQYDGVPRLVLLSDRTDDHMEDLINKVEEKPFNLEFITLLNEIHCKHVDRYMGRGYTILPKINETSLSEHQTFSAEKRPIWFIFSGMGSQWPKMGKGLMQLPLFRESIEKSHKVLEKKGLNLIDIITTEDETIFDNILHSFVGIAAVQIALVDILNALGIVPDGMIGHSVGELGCAYADGCFTAEQMLLAAYSRGKASIETELIKGFMAAVGKGYNEIKDELPEGIEVACHNAGDSCTISGPAEMVKEYVEELKSKGVFAKTVNVSNIAYHSQYIRPAAPKLLQYLKEVIPEPKLRSSKWISTSNLQDQWDTELAKYSSAEYHTNNLLSSVLFEEGSKHIPENAICIEVAPHGLLQAILKRSLGERVVNIPLTSRVAENPLIFLLQAIGKMHMNGIEPRIANLYEKMEFPVSRGTPCIHPIVHWQNELLEYYSFHSDRRVVYSLKTHLLKMARGGVGYYINDKNIYPVSLLLHLVWSIFAPSQNKKSVDDAPVVFENLRIESPISVQDYRGAEKSEDVDDVMICIQSGTGSFEIFSTYFVAGGVITMLKENPLEIDSMDSEVCSLTKNEIYNEFKRLGCSVGADFQCLESVDVTKNVWKGNILPSANWVQTIESLIQLQFLQKAEESSTFLYPISIGKLTIASNLHLECLKDSNSLDVYFNKSTNIVRCGGIEMQGLKFQKIAKTSNLRFESALFSQYAKPGFSDFWKFIDFSFNIALDNQNAKRKSQVEILEVRSDPSLQQFVSYLEKAYPAVKLKVETVSEPTKISSNSKKHFIITGGSYAKTLVPLLDTEGFILIHSMGTQNGASIPDGFEIISKFTVKNRDEMALVKKREVLNGEAEFITMPNSEAVLLNILKKLGSEEKIYYLIGYNEPEEGTENFKVRLQGETNARLRWLFILDETAPPFDRRLPFYSNQLLKGLSSNVYYKGNWGCFHRRELPEKSFEVDTNLIKSSNELTPNHVVLDLEDDLLEINQVEFSGKLKNQARVFGISKAANNRLQSIVCDEHFTWPLPSNWTLEDGATVPLSYVFAYYCLQVIANPTEDHIILVTDGMSYQGQAAASVALSLYSTVYVTVNDEKEKALLQKLFPKLREKDIFIHSDHHFDIELVLRTKGAFPTVIINMLEGEKFASCLNCIYKDGMIFHFGKEDLRKNVQLGTFMFLLSNSFYAISKELLNGLTVEEKKLLHDCVLHGIKEGVVKPLPKVSYTVNNLDKVKSASGLMKSKKIVLALDGVDYDTKQIRIDSRSSYVIIDNDSDLWVDLTEWLVKQGVRNIVVRHTGTDSGYKSARRMKISKRYKNVKCYYDDRSKNIGFLLDEATRLGPIAATFYISMSLSSNNQIAVDLDKVFRDKAGHYVVITSNKTSLSDICTERMNKGYLSTNFIWQVDESRMSQNLDSIKKLCGRESVIRVTYGVKALKQNTELLLGEHLPSSIEDYCKLGLSIARDCHLIKLKTLASVDCSKEASPIIIVPGLQSSPVDIVSPLAKNLMYPVYCVQLCNDHFSIKTTASLLLPEILKLRRANNYVNVIGISWGSYLSIELCRMLEESGATANLILIDGPLHNLKEGLIANKTLDTDLINLMRGLSNKRIDNEELPHETFQGKLDHFIRQLDLTPDMEDAFRKAALFIEHHLQAMIDYDYSNIKLEGPINMLGSGKSLDNTDVGKICYNVSMKRLPVARENLLLSKDVRNNINGCVINEVMSKGSLLTSSYDVFEEFLTIKEGFYSKKV